MQKHDCINYKMYLRGYHKNCYHHWRPDDIRRVGLGKGSFKGSINTGGLLWGEKGCGKSGVLAYLNHWAHDNEWINISVPSCREFVDASHDTERLNNGLYLQHTLAQRMLYDFKIMNEAIFNDMDVDMSRYGGIDISGNKDVDGEPCPRVYDELRQCWSDDWKQFVYEPEWKFIEQRTKDLDYRISDKCRDPTKMIDIINAGIEDPLMATNAIAEVFD